MSLLRTQLILFTIFALFLFSCTPLAFAHAGHEHTEEAITVTVTPIPTLEAVTVKQASTGIPVVPTAAGIIVGLGLFFLSTRILRSKKK